MSTELAVEHRAAPPPIDLTDLSRIERARIILATLVDHALNGLPIPEDGPAPIIEHLRAIFGEIAEKEMQEVARVGWSIVQHLHHCDHVWSYFAGLLALSLDDFDGDEDQAGRYTSLLVMMTPYHDRAGALTLWRCVNNLTADGGACIRDVMDNYQPEEAEPLEV